LSLERPVLRVVNFSSFTWEILRGNTFVHVPLSFVVRYIVAESQALHVSHGFHAVVFSCLFNLAFNSLREWSSLRGTQHHTVSLQDYSDMAALIKSRSFADRTYLKKRRNADRAARRANQMVKFLYI
jgi:hypothetical protein